MSPIRPAGSLDCAVLTRIVRTSLAYRGHYAVLRKAIRVAAPDLKSGVVRVFEEKGRIRGFYRLVFHPGVGELDLMFVRNGALRSGIGRALFADMVEVAAGFGCRGVLVVSHPPAAGFYVRMGARRIGVQPPHGKARWSRPRLWVPLHDRLIRR